MSKGKIAIVGARGINNYGGFETAVAEIGPRLVKEGFEVYCSAEKENDDLVNEFKGVKIYYFPVKIPKTGVLRTILEVYYDFYYNFIAAHRLQCDYVYTLGICGSVCTVIPRLFGKKSIVNVDGVEWRRSKFSKVQRFLLKIFTKVAISGANYAVVDNNALKNFINPKYWDKIKYIPYGVNEFEEIPWDQSKIDIQIFPNEYWLIVARLEPENNIHLIIRAYLSSDSKKPLVIVGDFVSDRYKSFIEKILKNKRQNKVIIFTGGIYDPEKLNMLRQNCFAYIHGHSVGGTNPSLLEIMAMKNIIIAHDNEFNREVATDTILYFRDAFDLKIQIENIDSNYDQYSQLRNIANQRVKMEYSWDTIINKYLLIFINNI